MKLDLESFWPRCVPLEPGDVRIVRSEDGIRYFHGARIQPAMKLSMAIGECERAETRPEAMVVAG